MHVAMNETRKQYMGFQLRQFLKDTGGISVPGLEVLQNAAKFGWGLVVFPGKIN